jgi:TetR/AcrR family transcriptional regulator, repressor of fatR-cypB operon
MPRPGPGESDPSTSEPDKRAAILEAALELFVERGFHGTAVPLVAKRANVGAGTIYRYFENKEALVNVVYRTWKEALATAVLERFPANASPREQFAHAWKQLCGFVSQHPRAYAFLELHHHAPYLDAESRAVEERIFTFAAAIVTAAQRKKLVRAGPAGVLLALLQGAFVGLVRFHREGRFAWTDEALACAEQAMWELIAGSTVTER